MSNDTSGEYNASQIEALEGLEAVRNTPGMYIGNTDSEGLHHMVYEVVDNSIDEAMGGYCDSISVTIHEDGSVEVTDNGRGIPVQNNDDGESALEMVMTKLHAGGKFNNNAYETSGGLHGVGVSVVNALSKRLVATVQREGVVWEQEFINGERNIQPIEKVGEVPEDETGTSVRFWPLEDMFETTDFKYEKLRKRLQELAFLNSGLEISIRDEREEEVKENVYEYEGGIREYVEFINETRENLHEDVIHIEGEEDGRVVEIAMQMTNETHESLHSFCNNINTHEGGTHVTGFKTAITRIVNDYAEENDMVSDGNSLKGADIREGLTCVISTRHPDPQFEGQTKTKLGNQDMRGIVSSVMFEEFKTFLLENPDTAQTIVKKAVQAAKARRAANKAKEATRRDSPLESTSLPGKLADCQSRDPEESELFIVEGDSAGGCFTGDTEIQLASGESKTFKQLVKEQENGETHYCYTVMNDGSIGIEKITNPRVTKRNSELVEVELDNGETIECTPDHKFMLRSGEYREAQELNEGESLMPLYTKRSDSSEGGITIDDYVMVKQPNREEFWEFAHRIADRFNLHNNIYTESDGSHRHHIDFDKTNNSPENLERLTPDEHMEIHNEHIAKTLHTEEVFEKLSELKQTDEFREKMSERMQKEETVEVLREQAKEQWENEDYVEYMIECFLEYYEKNSEEIDQRLIEASREYWSKEENRQEQSERVEEYYENHPEAVEQRRKDAKEQWDDEELREWRSKKTEEQWDDEFREQRMESYNSTYFENTIPFMKEYFEENGSLDGYDEYRKENGGSNILTLETTIDKFFSGIDELIEELSTHNHQVVSVTKLNKTEDVYDIEVPGTHNFALESGVFVHNSAKQGRDRYNQAVLPLAGKILNVEKQRNDLERILENDQIRDIVTAIGAGVGDEFDIDEVRYENIIIFVDADVDGAHIRTLLLTLFYRYMTPLLEQGYVYAAQPPLYRIRYRGNTYDAMSDDEKDEIIEEKCNGNPTQVQRFKGLGEMNPDQLWETTMNPENRILKRINVTDGAQADRIFSVLMGDSVGPRKEFIKGNSNEANWVDI